MSSPPEAAPPRAAAPARLNVGAPPEQTAREKLSEEALARAQLAAQRSSSSDEEQAKAPLAAARSPPRAPFALPPRAAAALRRAREQPASVSLLQAAAGLSLLTAVALLRRRRRRPAPPPPHRDWSDSEVSAWEDEEEVLEEQEEAAPPPPARLPPLPLLLQPPTPGDSLPPSPRFSSLELRGGILGRVLCCGALRARQEASTLWKPGYFILTASSHLLRFPAATGLQQGACLGSLSVRGGCTAATAAPLRLGAASFAVHGLPGGTLLFVARSEAAARRWVAALEAAGCSYSGAWALPGALALADGLAEWQTAEAHARAGGTNQQAADAEDVENADLDDYGLSPEYWPKAPGVAATRLSELRQLAAGGMRFERQHAAIRAAAAGVCATVEVHTTRCRLQEGRPDEQANPLLAIVDRGHDDAHQHSALQLALVRADEAEATAAERVHAAQTALMAAAEQARAVRAERAAANEAIQEATAAALRDAIAAVDATDAAAGCQVPLEEAPEASLLEQLRCAAARLAHRAAQAGAGELRAAGDARAAAARGTAEARLERAKAEGEGELQRLRAALAEAQEAAAAQKAASDAATAEACALAELVSGKLTAARQLLHDEHRAADEAYARMEEARQAVLNLRDGKSCPPHVAAALATVHDALAAASPATPRTASRMFA